MKDKVLLIITAFFTLIVISQEDAWVYFNAKENVAYAIANPITILTQKAIDRKDLHNVVIDFRDVPVDETYIADLKNTVGITVLAKTKWFNAVHVLGTEEDINNLLFKNFVSHIEFFNRNLNASRSIVTKNKFEVENKQTEFIYGNATNQTEMINVDDLHALGYTGEDVIIAALDTGFGRVNTMSGFQRIRDAGKILGTYDFYTRSTNVYIDDACCYHGTVTLSTMAGFFESEFTGTAPDASYYLFRTDNYDLDETFTDTPIEETLWIEAAERADSLGADIISSSLGFLKWSEVRYNYSPSDLDGKTSFITRGADMASEKGILVVNSAGNQGSDGLIVPADAENILTIGAVNSAGDYMNWSSQGNYLYQDFQKPDVMAQGWQNAVIHESDVVSVAHGTSYSSPIVAGAVACLWQALPNKTNAEIMQLVKESASQYNAPDNYLGYGIPDFGTALNLGLTFEKESFNHINVFPNPIKNILKIKFPSHIEKVNFELYDILGNLVMNKNTLRDSETINFEQLTSGIYFLKVRDSNLNINTFKLIKE